MTNRSFHIEYADSDVRELIFDENYTDVDENSFGEACFQAMMASDGNPCTLVLVVGGKDKRRWDLREGDSPRFENPDERY